MRVLVGPNQMGLEQVIPTLADKYPGVEFVHAPTPEDLARELPEAEVYLGWLNREQFLTAGRLCWLQSPSSGVDRFLAIPELAASERPVLTSARGTHGACLGDHTFALILAFTRGIRHFVPAQAEHRWAARPHRAEMVELTGSTMGIIGLGTVGRAIARRACAFDMRVIAVDVQAGEPPTGVERLEDLGGLDRLLGESDYVVVTVPYTSATHHMIGARELALMRPSGILIGISRGGIIDEAALADALRAGRLAGAGLDVLAQEPLPADSPLWDVPNLLITPHVAGGTQFECRTILDIFTENMARYMRGEFPLRNQVDKARGF